jgi:hypothetical protein
MKKICVFFGNCQCHVLRKLLHFSNFFEIYDTYTCANWELLYDPKRLPTEMMQKADLIIYQPLSDVHGCYSTNIHNENSFMKLIKPDCKTISFPRLHNNALFPIFKKKRELTIYYGKINNLFENKKELIELYNQDQIDFDFENRMKQNILISREKEKDCDVKIIDFIIENIKKHKLFLTQDHPTSFVMNEITKQICNILTIKYDHEKASLESENVIGLPDSVYNRSSNQYPISRYAMKYFEFEYIDKEDDDANDFYLQQLLNYYNV